MRVGIVAIVVCMSCGSGKKAEPTQASGSAPTSQTARAVAPKVSVASVLAADSGKPPPIVVLVDDSGLRVSWAATWRELATKDLAKAAKPTKLGELLPKLRDATYQGWSGEEAIAAWDKPSPPTGEDDPPPPEEEPPPPEDDESTAMVLEEGKMGKRDSDRAEGQYKMKKDALDAEYEKTLQMGGNRPRLTQQGKAPPPDPFGDPARLMRIAGQVVEDGKLVSDALILAAPGAKAKLLVDTIVETNGGIGVMHDGNVRMLRLDFSTRSHSAGWGTIGQPRERWLEARLSTKGVTIEAPPDTPTEVAWPSGALDGAQVKAALDKARASRKYPALVPVDVLVDADVDAQRLVDLLVALDVAGARMIGLGDAASADQLARRGKRNTGIGLGQPNAQGDLDKALIRDTLIAGKAPLDACVKTALAANPALEGHVTIQFFIKPDGKVAVATGDGVDPALAKCLAAEIKKLAFPKPKGGGGVQVNYPITVRP